LQDALIPLNEMRYLPQERRFILVANRFRWERAAKGSQEPATGRGCIVRLRRGFRRPAATNAGICIDRVLAVRSRNIDRASPTNSCRCCRSSSRATSCPFLFAGGGVIQVEIEALALYLSDLGKAWPTQWQPDHAADAADGKAARR
jgi:hypothetical protein